MTEETPAQKVLFCLDCGGWGTVVRRNLAGQQVVSSCPKGCSGPHGVFAGPDSLTWRRADNDGEADAENAKVRYRGLEMVVLSATTSDAFPGRTVTTVSGVIEDDGEADAPVIA